jgi:NDP-sugar pyrophosphorylase family protein
MKQGIILAAGKGKRLHPITTRRTKAMAPVAGKPMVERVIDMLAANGINEFIVLVSPEDGEITPHFEQARPDLPIRFVVQPERLGMAHALSLAAPYITGDFVLSACDNLTPTGHVGELIATHRSRNAQATLSLMPIDIAHASSTGIVDWRDGWVRRVVEKPRPEEAPSNISSLPLYAFTPRILEHLTAVRLSPRGEYELQDAIQLLIEHDGRVTGVLTDQRIQLTNATDLLALNRYYLGQNGAQALILTDQVGSGARFVPPLRIEAGVVIGQNCVIGPHVYIEAGCQVSDGVHLENVVVLRGAHIPPGERHSGVVLVR